MEFILANWEYIVIGILSIDKVVALSPTEWDDLIWTSIKKAIYKAVGKQDVKNTNRQVCKEAWDCSFAFKGGKFSR